MQAYDIAINPRVETPSPISLTLRQHHKEISEDSTRSTTTLQSTTSCTGTIFFMT
ncbi:MAG: hypothetical protein AB2809_16590 [Candidatus Thiodiazotropha sp.]